MLDCAWRAERSPSVSWTRDGVPLDTRYYIRYNNTARIRYNNTSFSSGLYILHSNGSLEVWPGSGASGDHVYQCRVSLGEVGTLLSTPATLSTPGQSCLQTSYLVSN